MECHIERIDATLPEDFLNTEDFIFPSTTNDFLLDPSSLVQEVANEDVNNSSTAPTNNDWWIVASVPSVGDAPKNQEEEIVTDSQTVNLTLIDGQSLLEENSGIDGPDDRIMTLFADETDSSLENFVQIDEPQEIIIQMIDENVPSVQDFIIEEEVYTTSSEIEPHPEIIETDVKHKSRRKKKSETGVLFKRPRNPESWRVNVVKQARLRGQEYVGVGGKIVPAKVMGPPCRCRLNCNEKIDEITRKELHDNFWKNLSWNERKQLIAESVDETNKNRRSSHNTDSLTVLFKYSLKLDYKYISVCKFMFLSTFAISEKFVRHAIKKKRLSPSGIVGPDLRGKHTPKTKKSETVRQRVRDHISSFIVEDSDNASNTDQQNKFIDSKLSISKLHKLYVEQCQWKSVPEKEIVKESYYREIFKTEFNISFKDFSQKNKRKRKRNVRNKVYD